MSNPGKAVYFENLDGLRFIAFICVFIQHAFLLVTYQLHFNHSPFSLVSHFFLFSGETGVSFFFCAKRFSNHLFAAGRKTV